MAGNPFYGTNLGPFAGLTQNPRTTANGDTQQSPVAQGRTGELLVGQLGGPHRSMAHRGGTFMAALTTAAGTIAVNTTTSSATWTLVNPAGSGVLIEPIDFTMSLLDTNAAPSTANVVGFSFVNTAVNAISGITKAPNPSGGSVPSASSGGFSGRLDQQIGMGYVATVITYASALTIALNWGYPMFSFPASWVPTVGGYPIPLVHDFLGKLLLPPGYTMSLVASTAWGANTVVPSMSWAEYTV